MIIEFLNGCLPWKKIYEKHYVGKAKIKFHKDKKQIRNFPTNFHIILNYIESLRDFRDHPNYELILDQLRKLQLQNSIEDNDLYDWEVKRKNLCKIKNTPNIKDILNLKKTTKV